MTMKCPRGFTKKEYYEKVGEKTSCAGCKFYADSLAMCYFQWDKTDEDKIDKEVVSSTLQDEYNMAYAERIVAVKKHEQLKDSATYTYYKYHEAAGKIKVLENVANELGVTLSKPDIHKEDG